MYAHLHARDECYFLYPIFVTASHLNNKNVDVSEQLIKKPRKRRVNSLSAMESDHSVSDVPRKIVGSTSGLRETIEVPNMSGASHGF